MSPWHQGTLHHFFDGGWMWVIPFDNHPDSENQLCSVGLSLDNHHGYQQGSSPEAEWKDVISRYPAIAAQLRNAVSVRPWVSTNRVQYSSSASVGNRYWLTPHATGSVDALFSMGNINTFQGIAAAVPKILAAFRDGEFRSERFRGVQDLTTNLLRFQDRIIFGTYSTLRSPELLETWLALWALTDTARIRKLLIPLVRFARTRDPGALTFYDDAPAEVFTGLGHCTDQEDCASMLNKLDSWCDIMQEMTVGRASVGETIARMRQAVHGVEPYRVDLDLMGEALGTYPWTYEALSRNGLRAYGTAFLTGDEVNTIGAECKEEEPPV